MAKKTEASNLNKFRKKIGDYKRKIRKNILEFPESFDIENYPLSEDPFSITGDLYSNLRFFCEVNCLYERFLLRANVKMTSMSSDIGSRRSQKAVIDVVHAFILNSEKDYKRAKKVFDKKIEELAQTYPKLNNDDVKDEITKYIMPADFIFSGEFIQW